jgi:DNA-binding MarR family transcriptional regulator
MRTELDPAGLEAWHMVMNAQAAVVDSLEQELRANGALPLASIEALALLGEAPDGAMRMQELSSQVRLSRSGATRLVDRLVAEGLVRRASCPSDRRGVHAILTDEGREALQRSRPCILKAIDEHFSRHLSREEKREMQSVLEKVLIANGQQPHAFGPGYPAG